MARMMVDLVCSNCGIAFKREKRQVSNYERKTIYCTRRCYLTYGNKGLPEHYETDAVELPFNESDLLAAVEGKEGIPRIRAMIKYYENCKFAGNKVKEKHERVNAYIEEIIDGLVGRIHEIQRTMALRANPHHTSRRDAFKRIFGGS